MPINRTTINKLYGLTLDEGQVQEFFEKAREKRDSIRTSEDVVLNSVGRDLYEKFFLNYTKKQWGLDPSELSAGVAARVPARSNDDDRYFQDDYQFMPAAGYTRMFQAMLDHPNISVDLGIDFQAIRTRDDWRHLVFTGPIDGYFNFEFGKLPYRSLIFEHQHVPSMDRFQPVGTINYPNDHSYTRITEFKHLTSQRASGTSIVREYPTDTGEPYYPIPRPENEALYKRYSQLASQEEKVTFVGRLAQYRYYNMDQVVATALKAADRILGGS
jgi:UDP-galactopyranose mutase